MTRILTIAYAVLSVGSAICGEPTISLTLAPEAAFTSGSVIAAGVETVETLDLVVSGALGDMDANSVSVRLNGNEIVGFARLSRMSDGFRAFLDFKAANHPHFVLKLAENDLQFLAKDQAGNTYRASWTINADQGPGAPVLSGTQPMPPPLVEHKLVARPQIRFSSDPPVHTIRRSKRALEALVDFEVTDAKGIRSVYIHLNGNELEAIQVRNGFPSRKRGKFRRASELPGTVTGGSNALQIRVPVPLPKAANFVRISASNVDDVEVTESFNISRPR